MTLNYIEPSEKCQWEYVVLLADNHSGDDKTESHSEQTIFVLALELG
jgi:hypothetical protein